MSMVVYSGVTCFIPKTAVQNDTPKINRIVEHTGTVLTDIFVTAVKVG